jgi:hypothetical protein
MRVGVAGPPVDLAQERGLFSWVHLFVANYGGQPIEEARVFLKFEQPADEPERQLLWSSNDGPVEELTLYPGQAIPVPFFARSVQDLAVSGDPNRLRHFPLPAWTTRLTDRRALRFQDSFYDLTITIVVRLAVRSRDGREVCTPRYAIPPLRKGDFDDKVIFSLLFDPPSS